MSIEVIVGLQRGDEGKGRFVDMQAEEQKIIARYNGGPNAGHTVVLPDGRDLALHQVPSGIAHEGKMNVIGNGVLLDPIKLVAEKDSIESKGIEVGNHNLMISYAAHLILPHHIYEDRIREFSADRQGTTCSGIAPAAAAKAMRSGMRLEMIMNDPRKLEQKVYDELRNQREKRATADIEYINEREAAKEYVEKTAELQNMLADTSYYLNMELRKEDPTPVLAEGAQAFLLDIENGMYPFTTSSSTTSGGVAIGLGVPPTYIKNVMGVAKAIQSHVGGGPFVTEIHDSRILENVHGDKSKIDAEMGTTTGRLRRLGYLDLPQIRRAQMVNGENHNQTMALSKADWIPRLGKVAKICVAYELNGQIHDVAPDSAYMLEQCTPIYEELPTWDEDIQEIREFSKLPNNAQGYVDFLEDQTGVKISMIGVGPRRDQVIVR